MRAPLLLVILALAVAALACATLANAGLLPATQTPANTPTATFTPEPTSTPTPPPTPTPDPPARVEAGDKAFFHGDWEGARKAYEAALASQPEANVSAAAMLGIARTQLEDGYPSLVVETLDTLITQHPGTLHAMRGHFFLARAYEAQSRFTDAADAYLQYLELRPGVVDAYVLDLRGDTLFAAGDYPGAGAAFQAAMQSPSTKDALHLQLKLARSVNLAGDPARALALYDDVFKRTGSDTTRALVDLRKGQIYAAQGQMDLANEAYLHAVNNYPRAYDAYTALVNLVNAGVPVDELQRGIVDYYAEQYGVAAQALERYLQNAPPDPTTAYYFKGLIARATGRYEGAVAEWDLVIAGDPGHPYWDDAYEQKAYTQWAYMDQYTLAVDTLLAFVGAAPEHPRAAEFLFDAAQIAERSGKLDQAASLWGRVARDYPLSEYAVRGAFLQGVSLYRIGAYADSLTAFRSIVATNAPMRDKTAALLWAGKCQQALGDATAATASWEQAANLDPTGYYSERARELMLGRAPFSPPEMYDFAVDFTAEEREAEAWIISTFGLASETDLSGLGPLASDSFILRGTELWELGLYLESRSEFEALRESLAQDAAGSYRLARYLLDLGLYRPAIMAARQVLNLAGMDDAGTMRAPAWFNHVRFGLYFRELVLPAAEEYGLHPLFLYSVMRQESLFEAFVRSSAAANGLMQIIPSTGESIARNMGWPPDYTTDDLYRPMVSVRFGTDYLYDQSKRFDGDLYAALAAYNGGPGNSMQWKALAPDDPDLFLEVIRFSETRNYIRGIYEIFSIYKRIYGRTP